MVDDGEALLGLSSLLSLIFAYGLFTWLGSHGLDDNGHRGPLAAAATGTLLATSLVLITGPGIAASAAAIVPWLMVSLFTWPSARAMSLAAGIGGWAIWWGIQAAGSGFMALRQALAA
jgi:hypothetical protein